MKKGVHRPTYRSWQMMKNRCLNPNAADFAYYGAKGITVPENWLTYEGFLADMGERPCHTTLDRRDGQKGYSKSNCRWATRQTQSQNRHYTLNVTHDGATFKSWEWAEKLSIRLATFHHRLWRHKRGLLSRAEIFVINPRVKK